MERRAAISTKGAAWAPRWLTEQELHGDADNYYYGEELTHK
jgi:hypothetical protein